MKYRIDFAQTVTEGCTVFVDADDREAAETKAMAMVTEWTPNPDKPEFKWKFVDVEQDPEIIGCEEWPPVNDRGPPIDPLPEGVTVVSLEDPVELHNVLAGVFGEPRLKESDR